MSSQLAPPPAPPLGHTTIIGLGDDHLREILLHLPDLPSLVRAAFACRTFRRAVRTSPAFRRSFHALHAPPLLALFLGPNVEAVPVLPSRRRSSDPGTLAADFFGIHLSRHDDPHATGWEIQPWLPSASGYLILVKERRASSLQIPKWRAAYSPPKQALDLIISLPDYIHFEFYTISSEDGQGPSHVVCIRHARQAAETESTAVVFSAGTMEWQISQKAALPLHDPDKVRAMLIARGLIYWGYWKCVQIVKFDTATCQVSLIDLPTPLMAESNESAYKLGEAKDGKLCIVDIQDNTLVSWLMTADDGGVVERWMVYKKFPLHPTVKEFTGHSIEDDEWGCNVRVNMVEVNKGFVYLSIFYVKNTRNFELYLSLCLETSEISELFNGAYRRNDEAHPYVMAWPSSLVQNKEESDSEFIGGSGADSGPVGTKEASSVIVAALQSLSQALMNDGDSNKEIVAELDAFLRPTEDEEGSLIQKITHFDAQLRTARDRMLRIRG